MFFLKAPMFMPLQTSQNSWTWLSSSFMYLHWAAVIIAPSSEVIPDMKGTIFCCWLWRIVMGLVGIKASSAQ